MAFTAETGDGIADANAAITVEFADDYHLTRNNTGWSTLTEAAKQGAIVNATDYIYREYDFIGIKFKNTQGLHFPVLADDGTGINPAKFLNAVAELAYIAKDVPLLNRTPQDRSWLIEDTTGPLVKRWAPGVGQPSTKPDLDWLGRLLEEYIAVTGVPLNYVERA